MVGDGDGHLIVLRGQRQRGMVSPEDGEGIDGGRWEFIDKQDGGGR